MITVALPVLFGQFAAVYGAGYLMINSIHKAADRALERDIENGKLGERYKLEVIPQKVAELDFVQKNLLPLLPVTLDFTTANNTTAISKPVTALKAASCKRKAICPYN